MAAGSPRAVQPRWSAPAPSCRGAPVAAAGSSPGFSTLSPGSQGGVDSAPTPPPLSTIVKLRLDGRRPVGVLAGWCGNRLDLTRSWKRLGRWRLATTRTAPLLERTLASGRDEAGLRPMVNSSVGQPPSTRTGGRRTARHVTLHASCLSWGPRERTSCTGMWAQVEAATRRPPLTTKK